MKITLKWPDNVPKTEFSKQFLQGMLDRMATSHFKYGFVKDAYENGVDFYKDIKKRAQRYKNTGNTEWLMDSANNAMMEFMYPSAKNAHFRPTESRESSGRHFKGEKLPSNTKT